MHDHHERLSLRGQTAIVTAAGAGIGRAIALEWASRGGNAVVADLHDASARAVAQSIREDDGRAIGIPLDVTHPEAMHYAVAAALATYGRIDTLFNVAGASLPRRVDEMDDSDWYRMIDINLTSVYRCSKPVIPHLRRGGGGSIVNISSTAGILAENRCSAYSAAKGGVLLLTKNMAMDYAPDHIRVNAICPGSTMTPRIQDYLDRFPGHDSLMDDICPMKRYAEPEEIARPAVFLASPDASYITGATLTVDGGLTAGKHFQIFEDA
ncbi:SDR family NAD(P)-dependent oxidoreductase [Rhodococcus erythropolis]|uniref:SDR family NAD(P)-dependent oxidoreductase n=1 Tax=Rhodococcus erythropolis TaxID=1833 RepID=UPI001BE71ADC|nr:SDR family NAD(P)-dependent oxidoreductase [Rhodococcus erythropolis]MBT2269002.1 SDR family oxidoreductase [Rhodococcus erythropolis]